MIFLVQDQAKQFVHQQQTGIQENCFPDKVMPSLTIQGETSHPDPETGSLLEIKNVQVQNPSGEYSDALDCVTDFLNNQNNRIVDPLIEDWMRKLPFEVELKVD